MVIISLILYALMVLCDCNVVKPPSERWYLFKEGDSITLTWNYEIDSSSEFVRIGCGRVNLSISASQDNLETLLLAENQKPLQIVQPSQRYATVSGQLSGRSVSVTFNGLKSSASGEYKCVLRVYHRGLGGVIKVDSRLTELTTVERDNQKDDEKKIIIGVLVGGVGFIIIIIILACIMYRRSKGQKSKWLSSSEEKKKFKADKSKQKSNNNNKKKVTKDDIRRAPDVKDQRSSAGSSISSNNGSIKSKGEPKYAKVQVVSTPDEALNRQYYDDNDSDMKEYV